LEEDLVVIEQQEIFGNKWAHISRTLVGRTENATKNRWNSLVKKAESKYPSNPHYLLFFKSYLRELIENE
jgi:myb proto-oncogene protein